MSPTIRSSVPFSMGGTESSIPSIPSAKEAPLVSGPQEEHSDRPRLVARPLDAETWALSLALPDFAALLRQAGLSPRDLEQARMRFRTHAENSQWATGRALFSYNGEYEEPLTAYPAADINVFSFERPLAAVQTLLRHRLTFPAQASCSHLSRTSNISD